MNKAIIIILIVLAIAGGTLGVLFATGVIGPGASTDPGTNPGTECDHEWKLLTEKSPTCLTDGNKKLICDICSAEDTIVLPATGHKLKTVPAVAPTCYSVGYTEKVTCQVITCGHTEGGEIIEMLDHSWVETPAKDPTCTENGYAAGGMHCHVCLAVDEDLKPTVIQALGHDYQPVDRVEPTCASDGYVGGTACTRCGAIDQLPNEILPKSEEHTAELVVVNYATCSSDGYSECPVCKERVVTEYRSSDKHVWTLEVAAVEASCVDQTDGVTAIYKCTAAGCGAVVGGQTIEWETLHENSSYMNWETTIEATETSAGERVGTCTKCNFTVREDIPVISDSTFEDENNIYPDEVIGNNTKKEEDDAA